MNQPLLISILVANACLVLLTILYYTVYNRYTFYRHNRWLLTGGLLLSVSIPFCRLPFFDKPAIVLEVSTYSNAGSVVHPVGADWSAYLMGAVGVLLAAGILAGGVRFLIRLYSLYRIHTSGRPASFNGIAYRKVSLAVAPFAFMGNIYLNPDLYPQQQLLSILQHEQVHIQGRHTADMLLAELVQILFWYNPWVLLLKQAVTQNLEYITDEVMVTKVVDKAQYQYSLLHTATHNQYTHLTNAFLFTNLKNRITMMNRNQTRAAFRLAYILALPCLGATALISSAAFAQQKVIITQTQKTVAPVQQEQTITVTVPEDKAPVSKTVSVKQKADRTEASSQESQRINIGTQKSDDLVEMQHGEATVTAQRIVVTTGDNEQMQMTINGEPVGVDQKAEKSEITARPLIIIDGVIQDKTRLVDINPHDVVSMEVLKDPAAVAQYGPKAKDGVIKIITKKAK